MLFIYLEAFCNEESFEKFYPEFRNLDDLKKAYAAGGIGDGRVKKFLYEVLNDTLTPIRERREEMAKRDDLIEILRRGTESANEVANRTLAEVKAAMGIDYFVK